MSSLVSIIMPCYNSEKYLDMSIGSVYEQDYDDLELIIVNDGSTDSSEKKILEWKKKFESKGISLIYVYQENKGPGAAINHGLKHVTGKYLSLLDSDDRFYKKSISMRADFLDKNEEYAGVRSNGFYVKKEGKRLFVTEEAEKRITDLFTALTLGKTNNWAGTYMLRTNVLFEVYPDRNIFPSRLGQNFQLLLPVSYKRKFGYIDEPLMDYYVYDNSHSHASDPSEQYALAKKNHEGWKEIYYKTLETIKIEQTELKLYHDMYDSVYYRRDMCLALEYNKRKEASLCYKNLKETRRNTIDDAIYLYSSVCKPLAFVFRVLRKMKKIIRNEKH